MSTEVIIALIGVASIVVATGMKMAEKLFEWWLVKRAKKHNVKELVDVDYSVHKELEDMLSKFGATRICISRLHNGGVFFGGVPMEKFTMTHEVVNELQVSDLLQTQFQNQLLSRFSLTFMKLLHNGFYTVPDVEALKDVNLKMFLQKEQLKSAYFLLIKDLTDNKPIAFLSLYYQSCDEFEKDDHPDKRQELVLRRDKLAGLLTLSFKKYEN